MLLCARLTAVYAPILRRSQPQMLQDVREMGSAPASGAVRRAPAPNSIRLGLTRRNANGEGAVGSARGGRAPRFRLNHSGRSSILSLFVRFFLPAHIIFMKTNGHRR